MCIRDRVTEEELHAFADIYAACGYQTLYVSAKEEKGVDALLELLKGKTAAVAGPSGVGKSSLAVSYTHLVPLTYSLSIHQVL